MKKINPTIKAFWWSSFLPPLLKRWHHNSLPSSLNQIEANAGNMIPFVNFWSSHLAAVMASSLNSLSMKLNIQMKSSSHKDLHEQCSILICLNLLKFTYGHSKNFMHAEKTKNLAHMMRIMFSTKYKSHGLKLQNKTLPSTCELLTLRAPLD